MTSYEDILAARARLDGHAVRTPLVNAPQIDAIAGRRVLVKAECLQRTGSFKFRGAWNCISALPDETRKRGVVAFSSGNHAQGVALSSALHGIPAVIIMPQDAPATKIDATRDYGAEVVLYDRYREDRDAIGEALASERGLTLVRPFDDPQVIAGQGTCGLEIAEQAHEARVTDATVLVCCGGGGFSSGTALALEGTAPGLRVRPVEPAGFDDFRRSLETGTPQTNEPGQTSIQDAIVTPTPGKLTFPIGKRLFGPGLASTDDEALRAVALAWKWLKIVVEPGGATALAAALFQPEQIDGDTVIVTASGGNIDATMFGRALATLD